MLRILTAFILVILCACNSRNEKPSCSSAQSLDTFPGMSIPYSGYYNLDSAISCSRQTGRNVLAVYSGYGSVSDFKPIWNILLSGKVKEIIDAEYIVTYLNLQDTTAVQSADTTIKTLGHAYCKQLNENYQTNTQPLYVILNSKGKSIVAPMGYTRVEDENAFIEFLEAGINTDGTIR